MKKKRSVKLTVKAVEDPERFDDPPPVRVLGIDPGFANVGLMVIEFSADGAGLIHREKVITKPEDGEAGARLDAIARRIHCVICQFLPDAIGVENVTNVGFQKGGTNASSAEMLKVPGMARALALVYGCPPVFDITTAAARATLFGKGKSRGKDKADVKDQVEKLLAVSKLNHEQGDAGAIAFAAFARYMETQR